MSRYDAVIIGAGTNRLAAAALLAKAGRKVLVLERRSAVGGVAASDEFRPGYRTAGLLHDTTGLRRGVVDALALESHGLRFSPEPPSIFVPHVEREGILLHWNPEKAAEEIDRFSDKDVAAYRRYRAFMDDLRGVVSRVMDSLPPDPGQLGSGDKWSLLSTGWALRRLGKDKMMEVLRVAPMCVADWLNEWFETDLLKAALAYPAVVPSFTGPWSPGTAATLLLWETAAAGRVVGGPAALAAVLERAATANGVTVRLESEVKEIVVDGGRATGVRLHGGEEIAATSVGASCDPRHVFLDLVPSQEIPYQLEHRIRHFRGYGTVAQINLAIEGPLEFTDRIGEQFPFARVVSDLDGMEKSFDPVKYDELPERPILDIHVPTVESPELAKDGHNVVSILAHFVPYRLGGEWDDKARETLGDTVLRTLADFAPTLPSQIIGREVLAPPDLEERYGLVEGHPFHGDHALDQLVLRPAPECARYRTPVEGLFLCGSGSHPGGGITCAPGAIAAKTILAGG
jgi:phytoene dehydrogenase-like protein